MFFILTNLPSILDTCSLIEGISLIEMWTIRKQFLIFLFTYKNSQNLRLVIFVPN